ncbi:MAG: hypothetical protein MMC33_002548 [Icmadophila ericetorum]|nr:hypothetical protein [Icmadophila ericetorum]
MSKIYMSSILLHPVIYYILQNIASIVIVGFTSPTSLIRHAALPPMLLCNWILIPMYLEETGSKLAAGLLCVGVTCNLLGYVDTALLRKWSFEAGGPSAGLATQQPTKEKSESTSRVAPQRLDDSGTQRLRFGYFAVFSSRYCGSPYEVPHVPPFDYKNPTYVPSRVEFFRNKAQIILLSYVSLDLVEATARPELNRILFAPQRIAFLDVNNLSIEHLAIRIISTLGFWAVFYNIIQLLFSASAIILVATDIDDPKDWPPIFGQWSEVYTLRGFWSYFWHQLIRSRFVVLPELIVYKIFRLRRGRLLTRYTNLFLVFLASGIFHLLIDIAQGLPFAESGSIKYYCLQALGIMLEDGVQAVYRSLYGLKRDAAQPPSLIVKLVGYAWVLSFFVLFTPMWLYPTAYRNNGEEIDRILPFSIINYRLDKITRTV